MRAGYSLDTPPPQAVLVWKTNLVEGVVEMCRSTIRTCRFTATVTALQLVSTFVRVATRLREARETTQRQMAAEESKARPSTYFHS